MVSMRSGRPICPPPSLSGVFPLLQVEQFQWLTMALSRPLKEDRCALPLSTPLSYRRSMVWCVLGFVPAGSVSKSSVLQIFRDAKPPVMVALPASLSALSFPLTLACPGQYTHRSLRRWMSNIDTCQSGLPNPLFTFWSRLIESVRMMACVVWLSPSETIQRRACVTAFISIAKLEVETS